jgi:hypothetical protein
VRLLAALAAACVVAAGAYPAIRLLEALLFPQANPVTIVWASTSTFAWRVILAAHAGALGAFGGYALAARSPATCARWLARAVPLAVALLAAQTVLRP